MIEDGLIEEARKLFKYRNLNALNTVGYKELFEYINNNKQTNSNNNENKSIIFSAYFPVVLQVFSPPLISHHLWTVISIMVGNNLKKLSST